MNTTHRRSAPSIPGPTRTAARSISGTWTIRSANCRPASGRFTRRSAAAAGRWRHVVHQPGGCLRCTFRRTSKERIEGLHCYHRVTTTQNTKRRHTKEEAEAMENAPPIVHPLVPRDPRGGRAVLFVNVPIHSRGIVETSYGGGDDLLRDLYRHAGNWNSIYASAGDRIPSLSGRTTTPSTIRCPTTSHKQAQAVAWRDRS